MRKCIVIAIIGVFMPLFAFPQLWEIGIMVGASNYAGDLSPSPIVFKETHPAIGALVRANINPKFTLKGNVYYGRISGSDENASTVRNRERNLSFRSNILDLSVTGELNLTGFEAGSRRYRTSPYLFAGLGIFKFDPETYYEGTNEWVRLQPLGTEGQGTTQYNDREKYGLTQVAIPFGLGIKHNLGGNWNIGAEFGWRKTFTDYLDDVSKTYAHPQILRSQSTELSAILANRTSELTGVEPPAFEENTPRGNSTNMDWYMMGGITITYTILPSSCFKF